MPAKSMFVPPMLAEQHATVPRGPEWLYEVKLDGYRVQALKHGTEVRLVSRKGHDLSADYPGVVEQVARLGARTAVLDGEIVALDRNGRPSFQALQNRASSKTHVIAYFAFDLLQRDGKDLRSRPLVDRKKLLATLLSGSGLHLSESLAGDPDDIVRAVQEMKLEGILAKRRSSRYVSGRSGDWVKVKFLNRQELVIGAYKPGLGNFESLVVGYYEDGKPREDGTLRFAGKVRNGFTPHLRATIWRQLEPLTTTTYPFAERPTKPRSRWGRGLTTEDVQLLRWVRPELVAEIGFVEWTEEGHLRHPTFLGLRSDKRARDVVREEGVDQLSRKRGFTTLLKIDPNV